MPVYGDQLTPAENGAVILGFIYEQWVHQSSQMIERWISRISWLQLILPVGLILGIGMFVLYPRITSPDMKLEVKSPDGHVTAEVDRSQGAGATETVYTGVRLRSGFSPFRHYVFGGLDYGAKVTISWMDSRNLRISCENCEKFDRKEAERNWHGITIHYVIDQDREKPGTGGT